MKKVNLGVIGVGRIGQIHTRNLKFQVAGAKVLAVADVMMASAKKVAEELEIPTCEADYRSLLKNGAIDVRAWYEPFVKASLQSFCTATVYVVLDSTQYGAGCRALVVGIAYAGQVLPVGWRVIKGRKGHTDPDTQNALLSEIRALLPPGQVNKF